MPRILKFYTAGAKTSKTKYYDLVKEARELRKSLMLNIVKNPEGEIWCISKHLLGACMRLMEVGTKQLSLDKKEKAYDFFKKAYDLYSLFWGINMDIVKIDNVKKIDEGAINKSDTNSGLMTSLWKACKKRP